MCHPVRSFSFAISARSLLTFDATPPVVRLDPIATQRNPIATQSNASGLDGPPIRVRLEPLAVFAAEAERPVDRDGVAVPIAHFEVTVLWWFDRMWACGDWK